MTQPQQKPGWCGPNSVRNAARIYGIRKSQASIARGLELSEGWDEDDILNSITELGLSFHILESNRQQDAREFLQGWVHLAPVILCVDHWEHWVTIIGGCGPCYLMADGDNDPRNQSEQGIYPLRPKTVLKRWRAARKVAGKQGKYYGVVVLPGGKK